MDSHFRHLQVRRKNVHPATNVPFRLVFFTANLIYSHNLISNSVYASKLLTWHREGSHVKFLSKCLPIESFREFGRVMKPSGNPVGLFTTGLRRDIEFSYPTRANVIYDRFYALWAHTMYTDTFVADYNLLYRWRRSYCILGKGLYFYPTFIRFEHLSILPISDFNAPHLYISFFNFLLLHFWLNLVIF